MLYSSVENAIFSLLSPASVVAVTLSVYISLLFAYKYRIFLLSTVGPTQVSDCSWVRTGVKPVLLIPDGNMNLIPLSLDELTIVGPLGAI